MTQDEFYFKSKWYRVGVIALLGIAGTVCAFLQATRVEMLCIGGIIGLTAYAVFCMPRKG